MKAHIAVTHFALDLGTGNQRRNGVHYNDVDSAGTNQRLGDFQRLLAGIRLGDQHFIDIDAQRSRVCGIQRVLGVHKGHLAALFLGFRRHMERQRGLAGGFRPIDLHDPPTGQTAHAQRHIQRQGTCGDHIHLQIILIAKAHNGALAVHFLNLAHGRLDGPLFILRRSRRRQGRFLFCHMLFLPILIFYLYARSGRSYSL